MQLIDVYTLQRILRSSFPLDSTVSDGQDESLKITGSAEDANSGNTPDNLWQGGRVVKAVDLSSLKPSTSRCDPGFEPPSCQLFFLSFCRHRPRCEATDPDRRIVF